MKKNIKATFALNLCIMLLAIFCLPLTIQKTISSEKRYCDAFYIGGGQAVYVNETLDYDYYVNSDLTLTTLEIPTYLPHTELNSCAPTAGANCIGYYDFYNQNLIPNYDTYFLDGGYYSPKAKTSQIVTVMSTLYTGMGTNVGGDGTTQSGFYSGMNSYIQNHGYSMTYTSMGSGSTMINNCKSAFNNDRIVVLFLNSYEYIEFVDFGLNSTNYSFTVRMKTVGHVVFASGYHQYEFYANNQLIETDKFFEVSFSDGSYGLLRINDTSCIDNAYCLYVS